MSGLLPNFIMRQFASNGLLLSGGKMYFYESGTYIPKPTYTDYTYSVENTNPVILSASGSARIWLSSGAYRVLITDMNDVQVEPFIDGIVGDSIGGLGSTSTFTSVKTYNELRALTVTPDTVYVAGNTVEGDGGQGLFQLIPVTTLIDDGGIVLQSATGVYKRITDNVILPEWYEIKCGINIDQTTGFNAAMLGSVQWNLPLFTTNYIYLNQNVTVPNGASITCVVDGFFLSGSAITMTFATGSKFDSIGSAAFGSTVQPIFNAGVARALYLSWMGGASDYIKWTKLIASTSLNYKVIVDVNTTIGQDLSIPANFAVDFVGGSKIIFNALANLNIATLVYTGVNQIISYGLVSYIGTVNLGSALSCIEWFGGLVGVGPSIDNIIAFKAAASSGNIRLLANNYYYIKTSGSSYTLANDLNIIGYNGAPLELVQPIVVNNLSITDAVILGAGTITSAITTIDSSAISLNLITTSAYVKDSTIYNVTNLTNASNTTFTNFTGTISGNVETSKFSFYGTIPTINDISFSSCQFIKVSGSTLLFTPTAGSKVKFNTCGFGAITDTLFYATSGSVYLNACTSDTNFTNIALSTGLVQVYLNGCGIINNSSAYSIDGITQSVSNMLQISPSSATFTASSAITNWKGLGSVSSDGTYLSINGATVLSSNPYSTNTIRYIGNANDSTSQLQWFFRLGGVIETTIIYPVGVAPNPASRITTACLIPRIQDPVPNVAKIHSNILGQNVACSMPAINGSTLFYKTNVWGGQVNLNIPSTAALSYTYTDIYGDFSQTLPANAKVFRVPRVVIYDQAGIGLPIGTKIKVDLIPYLPYSRDQYVRFFPKSFWYAYYEPVDPFGGANGSYIQTSLRTTYTLAFTQLKTPYEFRDVDDTGVQVSLSRKQTAGGTWSTIDLPVSTWFGPNTINNGFS